MIINYCIKFQVNTYQKQLWLDAQSAFEKWTTKKSSNREKNREGGLDTQSYTVISIDFDDFTSLSTL